MSREEFLTELRKALQGRVSQQTVNDNLRYYEEYILTESHKGKTEAEVIAELGNPRLLAKSIIDAENATTCASRIISKITNRNTVANISQIRILIFLKE